jgi:Uma2 family endonuclease
MAISEQALSNLIGEIVATNVSLDDYMEHYAAQHCEWVEGVVIKMSGSLKHNDLNDYLRELLRIYFALRVIGRVISQPFMMRLPAFPNRRREPDLMVVLKTNPNEIKATYLDGPADICIEIVSEESVERDHGDKFREYEQGGVPEYWIVDPLHHESRFYRLNGEGSYVRQTEDADGNYHTPLLPGLALHVSTLWRDDLPNTMETLASVTAMLED